MIFNETPLKGSYVIEMEKTVVVVENEDVKGS